MRRKAKTFRRLGEVAGMIMLLEKETRDLMVFVFCAQAKRGFLMIFTLI
jgi:hypothetical protein